MQNKNSNCRMLWRSSRRALRVGVGFDDDDKRVGGLQMLMKHSLFFPLSLMQLSCFVFFNLAFESTAPTRAR